MNVISNSELKAAQYPVVSLVSSKEFSINKISLSHLPTAKRQQLQKAVEVILESAHSNNASKPSMLILFGSYARGNWIEERVGNGQNFNYQSSFDLLAVTKNALSAKKLECKKSLHKALTLTVETPVNLIAEDIQFVNRHLAKGHYFYTDMLRDGVVLYDSGAHLLSAPLGIFRVRSKTILSWIFRVRSKTILSWLIVICYL